MASRRMARCQGVSMSCIMDCTRSASSSPCSPLSSGASTFQVASATKFRNDRTAAAMIAMLAMQLLNVLYFSIPRSSAWVSCSWMYPPKIAVPPTPSSSVGVGLVGSWMSSGARPWSSASRVLCLANLPSGPRFVLGKAMLRSIAHGARRFHGPARLPWKSAFTRSGDQDRPEQADGVFHVGQQQSVGPGQGVHLVLERAARE